MYIYIYIYICITIYDSCYVLHIYIYVVHFISRFVLAKMVNVAHGICYVYVCMCVYIYIYIYIHVLYICTIYIYICTVHLYLSIYLAQGIKDAAERVRKQQQASNDTTPGPGDMLDNVFVAYAICNIIIYILCFIVIMFICISIMFNIICVGFSYIVYVMRLFVVLFFCYTRSPLEDSRLFGPSPWKVLATAYE